MKKILVLSVIALLALAGCASGSNLTPDEAFTKAKEALVSGQTIDFSVASVIKTENGDISFDNFGKIVSQEGEDFSGKVTVKAKVEDVYEDLVIYVSEGKYYLELNDTKTVLDKDTLLALGLVDFTLVNTLVDKFDVASTENNVHTYVRESDDLSVVNAFSSYSHLSNMTLVEGTFTQTLTVTDNKLSTNNIYVSAIYMDADGNEYPVTQAIELKYSAASKVDTPDFSEFK